VIRTAGAKESEVRKALRIAVENRAFLMEKWKDFHG
jgi:hypothetical protein